MSSYGENLLKKYGWDQGKGIGKNEQGMVNPIKASFKFDTAGVGYDQAEEFTVNWWEHLFNHTAKKIKTDQPNGDIVSKSETKANDKTKTFNNKNLYYSRFQKASTLENGQEKSKTENKAVDETPKEEESYDKKGKKIVSDEELYRICEGRTAHKGARHGVKMNGKLARIMEQEQQVANVKVKIENEIPVEENNDENSEVKKKKKKKKRKNDDIEIDFVTSKTF